MDSGSPLSASVNVFSDATTLRASRSNDIALYGFVGVSLSPMRELSHLRRECRHSSPSPLSRTVSLATVIASAISRGDMPFAVIVALPRYTPGAAFGGIITPHQSGCTRFAGTSSFISIGLPSQFTPSVLKQVIPAP